jgi:hypothetical protein
MTLIDMIHVNGVKIQILPYSESRLARLVAVQNEIDEYIDNNPDVTFENLDRKLVAKWWKAKADVIWEPEKPLDIKFFESPEFESGLLKKSETFFLSGRVYL